MLGIKRLFIFASAACLSITLSSIAAPVSSDQLQVQRQHVIDMAVAPIHSAADLNQYVIATPPDQSPLSALSPSGRQRFIESLKFNQNGLTTYDYQDIEAELTAKQAYVILSLFGSQRSVAKIKTATPTAEDQLIAAPLQPAQDYRDFSCGGHATCIRSPGDICIGDNCK